MAIQIWHDQVANLRKIQSLFQKFMDLAHTNNETTESFSKRIF